MTLERDFGTKTETLGRMEVLSYIKANLYYNMKTKMVAIVDKAYSNFQIIETPRMPTLRNAGRSLPKQQNIENHFENSLGSQICFLHQVTYNTAQFNSYCHID